MRSRLDTYYIIFYQVCVIIESTYANIVHDCWYVVDYNNNLEIHRFLQFNVQSGCASVYKFRTAYKPGS